jgi:hypothetical protein
MNRTLLSAEMLLQKQKMKNALLILVTILFLDNASAQTDSVSNLWHGKERSIRYQPEGTDFVIQNGKRRFVRAIYGTNTAFRIEAGDLPEFALYMPGMGGNFKFGIISGGWSKWITDATSVKAIYRPGSMIYEIKDPILGDGVMNITVSALSDAEGMIIQTSFKNMTGQPELLVVFGGASGKKFSRDGDIGADPESSFYLNAENCRDNSYSIDKNSFHLSYGTGKVLSDDERYEIQNAGAPAGSTPKNLKQLSGLFPPGILLKQTDAFHDDGPDILFTSDKSSTPVLAGKIKITNTTNYYLVREGNTVTKDYTLLKKYFDSAEAGRAKIANRVKVNTPDKYINTIGGALSIAADAIWEDPSYLHGAVAWRMRLNAWRGAYVADPLGWHDRARKHFSSYALSQITTPPVTGVVMDTALHLARHLEKIGTALFSDGYICRNPNGDIRAHHYDMNLVFVDQLLNHFNWTGDTAYVKEMWPLIKKHLAWEKRNFDADGDGLYDAYAAIWASDALQYSGGGVTHSSAYNYRANKMAAELATLIGEDGSAYKKEAEKIFNAVQKNLWLAADGHYAEYKDLLGNKLVHPAAGIWTIYHTIDSKLPDPFQSYQSLEYVDSDIPHIPVKIKGLPGNNMYLLSTTNWQPYTWSVNNVALAENLHMALAYWQGNRNEKAYRLWRTAILESMYASASPGGFEQLSYYDAIRGELYRDFADPVGMAARSLVEGLFGIQPDALHDTLTIQPGYPFEWNYASLQIPDVQFDFKRASGVDTYVIRQFFKKNLKLKLLLQAYKDEIASITVNGKNVKWSVSSSVGKPMFQVNASAAKQYTVVIHWKGKPIRNSYDYFETRNGHTFQLRLPEMKLLQFYDPQHAFKSIELKDNRLNTIVGPNFGVKTFFVQLNQGQFTWWQPFILFFRIGSSDYTLNIVLPTRDSITGNLITTPIDLSKYFNDKVTSIFKHQYLSPRPASPTLQLPTQGIGNWCYPMVTADLNDNGLRKKAGAANEITSMKGIPFRTPSDSLLNNILFTSQWDNFPNSISIPVSGNASQLYLLMAGSTNPMQSRIVNGLVSVKYTDGSADTLLLSNPENWWPIEQDYYIDNFAFTSNAGIPERLYLKEGIFGKGLPSYSSIKGFSNRAIDGGAATVLDMPLDHSKTLQSLTVQAVANDVVIGLMAATLVR